MQMMMEGQTVATTTKQLYEAVIMGDLTSFRNLLMEDPLIIDRCVIENSLGGFNQSPLHVAVDMGHLEMVKSLLNIRPSMCLANDQGGRNPIHVAAIQGRVDVLKVLHEANPYAAQERIDNGQTILHLCVKYRQLNALKRLLELIDDDGDQLLNSNDNNGNTVLHLAVAGKQPEMVEYLLTHEKMKKNSINKNDMTAVDIHMNQSRKNLGDEKIKQALKGAKAKRAKGALNKKANQAWYEEQRTSMMVVASLIATMAFQVGINPPGGVWQDDTDQPNTAEPPTNNGHKAGFAIWSYHNHNRMQFGAFNAILICNTVSLLSSLSVVLLLISGLKCKRYFLLVLRITLRITVTATTLTYGFAVKYLAYSVSSIFNSVLGACIIGWLVLIFILFLVTVVRFISFISASVGWRQREPIRRCFNKWFTWSHHKTAEITDDRHNCESP